MSNKIENLRDLFIEQMRELYDASKQEQDELPKIQNEIGNQQLKKVLDTQLNTSKNRSIRLHQTFKKLNISVNGEKSECYKSVIKDTKNLIERSVDLKVRDAAIINSIQRLNHNKIAILGALTSYARQLGYEDIASSFHEALNEEKAIDKELTILAKREINKKALTAFAI